MSRASAYQAYRCAIKASAAFGEGTFTPREETLTLSVSPKVVVHECRFPIPATSNSRRGPCAAAPGGGFFPALTGTQQLCRKPHPPPLPGRRVWLLANNPLGARANANLCSRVSTARANGLDASVYLTHLLERVPAADTAEALEAPLLP